MKPNVILENIEREKNNLNLKVPLKKDLNNFLYTLQKKKGNDMFGLMRKTTSVSTADIINTINHISNIEESSESPTFTTLTSFNTLPSTSTTITTQETLSLTASNEERLLLKRKNKETDNLIPKKKPGRPLGSKNKQ